MTEATKLYLGLSEDTEKLAEKLSEFQRPTQRIMLLAPEMMEPLNTLVIFVQDKIVKQAGQLPKLSLDEWRKITTSDLAVIFMQFNDKARHDLAAHPFSPLALWNKWRAAWRVATGW